MRYMVSFDYRTVTDDPRTGKQIVRIETVEDVYVHRHYGTHFTTSTQPGRLQNGKRYETCAIIPGTTLVYVPIALQAVASCVI